MVGAEEMTAYREIGMIGPVSSGVKRMSKIGHGDDATKVW
jgi:hypothetical protein